jgi:carboxyl-terminal processing protease
MLNAARWTVLGLLAASILVLAFAIGYVIPDGDDNAGGSGPSTDIVDGDRSEDLEGDFDFSQLNEIMELLNDKYVDEDRVDKQTLYEAAISGMLETLNDSGTFYIDPITVRTSTGVSGSFEGIGATVSSENGAIVIVAPIENTPAERAGILPGDVVLEVDGESTEGWTTEMAVLRIRGPKGTTVTLLIRHADGSEETLEIERDEIEVESVTTQPPGGTLRDGAGNEITDVGYIYIREFSQPTKQQFDEAIEEIVDSGKTGLILDMRNNPGGLLSTTVEIADEFLDDGTILVERERDGSEKSFTARNGGSATDIQVVILLNRFSASGSEVLAAALHDNDRGTIVGEKSFGKGTVNVANSLEDGGQLYVSIARWLTPDGTLIDGVGIRPDVPVALSDEDIDLRRDVQVFKAIDILRGTNFTPESALTPQPEPTSDPAATPTVGG